MTRLLLLSVLTLGVLSGLWSGHAGRPGLVNPVVTALKHAVVRTASLPAAPSAFDNELAMAPAGLMKRWEPLIAAASREFHVSQDWIRAVMRMESGGRTMLGDRLPITSTAGAMGLMQVMPETYSDMRAQYRLGADPYDPHDNVFAGAAYLRALYRKYGYPAMFAAYNDGPGNLENHLAGLRALPDETRAYVSGVASILGDGARGGGSGAGLARMTRPDGSPIMIDIAAVRAVRAPLPGEYADGVQSVITIGKIRQGVREDLVTASRLTLLSART